MEKGLGFFIWNLRSVPEPEVLADLCDHYDIKEVSIKMADGTVLWNRITVNPDGSVEWNQPNGTDDELLRYIKALRARGIKVGGWAYVYPSYSGTQGDIAEARVEKFGLSHWIINAEVEWKKSGLTNAINAYLGAMNTPAGFDVLFCSYRYPSYHPMDYNSWMNSYGRVTHAMPQVYWLGSSNPAWQMQKSYDEYSDISDKPFLPVGSMFNYGDWYPTTAQLKEFVQKAKDLDSSAWWFWSMDWVWKHWEEYGEDWLGAVSGKPAWEYDPTNPDPDPEPPPPQPLPDWGLWEITSDKSLANEVTGYDAAGKPIMAIYGDSITDRIRYNQGMYLVCSIDTITASGGSKWCLFGEDHPGAGPLYFAESRMKLLGPVNPDPEPCPDCPDCPEPPPCPDCPDCPEPPPCPEPELPKMSALSRLNVRSAPYTGSTVYFVLSVGEVVDVIETIQDGLDIWARIGHKQYAAIKYRGVTYLE